MNALEAYPKNRKGKVRQQPKQKPQQPQMDAQEQQDMREWEWEQEQPQLQSHKPQQQVKKPAVQQPVAQPQVQQVPMQEPVFTEEQINKGLEEDAAREARTASDIKDYDRDSLKYVTRNIRAGKDRQEQEDKRLGKYMEAGRINSQQGTTQQGAGTDDYMDSFRSIMDMLDEDNTASASTTPTYPAGYPGYGYGYPGYYPSSLGDVTSMLEPYHMPTKEDLKKEKRNMAIRALGDGISAIAGMAGAIHGGPNTVDATNSLTKTGRELIEKMREQRRKDYTAYLNAALKREQTNAANLRAMTQLERSREVSRRGRQTLALNVLDKINRWKNAKDANEIKDAHNKAIEAINKAKAEVEKQYKQGLISAKEKQLTLNEYDNVTKRINADANMTRAQKAGSGGGKSGAGSNGEAKVTVTENTDRYGDTKTTTRISGTAEQVKKAQNQRGSGSGSSGGGRGNGGGKFENTKKLGL